MKWGIKAYNDWRSVKLSFSDTYDVRILRSDVSDVQNLNKDDFEYSICRFLAGVVKVKDGSEYPGHTLFQLVVSIQKHLSHKGLKWKLTDGQFANLRNVLDNLMKE